MNLRYTLPDREGEALCPARENIVYQCPYDLDTAASPTDTFGGDEKQLFVLAGGDVRERLALADIEEILCVPQIDSGILVAKEAGETGSLCRFTMRHIGAAYSHVWPGGLCLLQGEDREVVSTEKEKTAPVAGGCCRGPASVPAVTEREGLRRFWDLSKTYIGPLALITLFMIGISGLTIGQQFIQRNFIDTVLVPAEGSAAAVGGFFAIMLGFAADPTLSIVRTLWSNSLGTRISRDLRARSSGKINTLSLSFIDSRQAGGTDEPGGGGFRQGPPIHGGSLRQHVHPAVHHGGALIVMLAMDWKLALLTVVFMPAAAILGRLFHRKEMRMWRQQWRFNDKSQQPAAGMSFPDPGGEILRPGRAGSRPFPAVYPAADGVAAPQ